MLTPCAALLCYHVSLAHSAISPHLLGTERCYVSDDRPQTLTRQKSQSTWTKTSHCSTSTTSEMVTGEQKHESKTIFTHSVRHVYL